MKKHSIITVMLAIAVTAGLSACGSSGQGTAGASQSQEKQQKASSSESKEKPDTERFEEMLAENTLDKMLSRHDNVLRESEIR